MACLARAMLVPTNGGAAGSIDAEDLQGRLDACLAENVPSPQPAPLDKALEWVRQAFGKGR